MTEKQKPPTEGNSRFGKLVLIVLGFILFSGFVTSLTEIAPKSSVSYNYYPHSSSSPTFDGLSDNKTEDSPVDEYWRVTKTGFYCTFTKPDFKLYEDIMFNGDAQALAEMTVDGRALRLTEGQQVSVLEYNVFGAAYIRPAGISYPCYTFARAITSR
jgi:hypothetical protein